MKRSLPVMAGLAAIAVIALLVGNGFLNLPLVGDEEPAAEAPVHDPAPRVDPEPLEVAYEDEDDEASEKKRKNRKREGKKESRKGKEDRKKRGKSSKDGGRKGSNGKATGPRDAPDVDTRNPGKKQDGAKPPPKKKKDGGKKPPPKDLGPVTVSDLRGDPDGEGQAPAYMDLEAVRLQTSGDLFLADLTFAGRIPAQMPNDGTAMLASVEVKTDDGDKVSVYAEASDDGWRAHTNRSADFPGTMSISGRTMRFTVPRSFFGDSFGFYAHSSWTKSTTTNTEYFFDFAPDDQNGRFPSGGTT